MFPLVINKVRFLKYKAIKQINICQLKLENANNKLIYRTNIIKIVQFFL